MKLFKNIAAAAIMLLLLAGILIPTVSAGGSPERGITRQEMSQAAAALLLYNQEYGHLPAETDNVLLVQILERDNPRKLSFYSANRKRSKSGQFIDGWGRPLVFKPTDAGLLIRSAGKDGIYFTPDDITQDVHIRAHSTGEPKGSGLQYSKIDQNILNAPPAMNSKRPPRLLFP